MVFRALPCAAPGADIGLAGADAHAEVEDVVDHCAVNAGAVVEHLDHALGDADPEPGRHARLFGSIDPVVAESLAITAGDKPGSCPICAVSSRLVAKSSNLGW